MKTLGVSFLSCIAVNKAFTQKAIDKITNKMTSIKNLNDPSQYKEYVNCLNTLKIIAANNQSNAEKVLKSLGWWVRETIKGLPDRIPEELYQRATTKMLDVMGVMIDIYTKYHSDKVRSGIVDVFKLIDEKHPLLAPATDARNMLIQWGIPGYKGTPYVD